jgi:hypothetical protein
MVPFFIYNIINFIIQAPWVLSSQKKQFLNSSLPQPTELFPGKTLLLDK